MNIYLIGMPGCGKTTVGKKLADHLGYEFKDLDLMIEEDSLMVISDIFERYGEETFRNQETKILSEITGDNLVISTGGGIIKRKSNKDHMKGIVIYIKVSLEELERRLQNDSSRPLLQDNTLEDLYLERKELYEEFADFTIHNKNIDDCIKDIIEVLK